MKENDKEIRDALENGQTWIWENESKSSLEEFIDYAVNGLSQFGYDHLIYGYDSNSEEPSAVGVCRGNVFALEAVLLFNDCNLKCIVHVK